MISIDGKLEELRAAPALLFPRMYRRPRRKLTTQKHLQKQFCCIRISCCVSLHLRLKDRSNHNDDDSDDDDLLRPWPFAFKILFTSCHHCAYSSSSVAGCHLSTTSRVGRRGGEKSAIIWLYAPDHLFAHLFSSSICCLGFPIVMGCMSPPSSVWGRSVMPISKHDRETHNILSCCCFFHAVVIFAFRLEQYRITVVSCG